MNLPKKEKKILIIFTFSYVDFFLSLNTNLGIVFNTYTEKNQFCPKCQASNVIFSKGLIVMNTQEYPK